MVYSVQLRTLFSIWLLIVFGTVINPMLIGAISRKYPTVIYSDIGGRSKQEDFFLKKSKEGLFGVFDGHAGDKAARVVQKNFSKIFEQTLREVKDPKQAFIKSFLELDRIFLTCYPFEKSGAAVVVAFINEYNDTIYLAHAGDCRALVMGHMDELLAETRDHKPDAASEKDRIEGTGATVTQEHYSDGFFVSRICLPGGKPGLSMSRSIGDNIYKRYGCIAKPDVLTVALKDANLIVLASDGLWQVMESEEVVRFVNDHLRGIKGSPSIGELGAIVELLGKHVASLWERKWPSDPMDNTTIMLVWVTHNEVDEGLCDPRSVGSLSPCVSITYSKAKYESDEEAMMLSYAEELEVDR